MGYTIVTPRDEDVTWLSSGLLTMCRTRSFTVTSSCFCSFQQFHNVEQLANKGFHILRLRHSSGRTLQVANTHTQSNTAISWWFGTAADTIRRQQIQQMLDLFGETGNDPVLVAGDFNCEVSPHPHMRFLHPGHPGRMNKHTFYSTGEDLDHIAWIPVQRGWSKGCSFCDIVRHGPVMESCQVFEKPWSDHAPLMAALYLPHFHGPG